ncbi:ankyrin repeat domain-containing protein [Curvularia clavata]|uniref:Ankyrin repeat domain-containing protein n=1 Tax=Curvularia clavata TaxID=95742 RepID=A0A9Q8ZIY3_CURCL|nr:ankyrin repeat domain-containing protein [Curvularia clavata]
MFPSEVSREADLVMERWKAESGRFQEPASSSAINPTPAVPPSTHALENSDESLRRFPLEDFRNYELHEQGPIGSLYKSLIETLGLILIEVRMHSNMTQHHGSLEKSCAALFFWGIDLGLWRGELDDMLQDSRQLRDICLTVLVSICQFVSTSLIQMISSEPRQKKVLQSTAISTCLEQAMNMIEEQHHSTYRPEQDPEALCQTLRTKIDTLIMLAPSLASPAEESFDDEEPRAIQDIKEHLPEQAYANSISQKFPLAASAIVARLGKLNWDRYNHVLRLQRETIQQELQTTALEKAKTIFHDSGLGVSLPTQSEVGFKIIANPSRPESIYAPSVVSSRAEASHKRVPPLPAQARSGEPFTCEICNRQVDFRRTKAWKKHVFDDILAYACFFAECRDTQAFFENSEALMNHLQDHHGMDIRVSEVTCPLCVEFISGDRNDLSLHIARHMEEVALAVLPSGVESDEESVGDSTSEISSSEYEDHSQELHVVKLRSRLAQLEKETGPDYYYTIECMHNLAVALSAQGQYEEAEAMNRQVLERYEKVLGPNHPTTLGCMSNLAAALSAQGQYKEAEVINRQVLERSKKELSGMVRPDHPTTLGCMSNLAAALSAQGQYEEAEEINRQTLEQFEKVLGPDHPRTLASRNNLSLLLERNGRDVEAESGVQLSLGKSNSTASSVTQEQDHQEAKPEIGNEVVSEEDGIETRYCYCNDVSYGNMIACDNDDCSREWFHLKCAGLEKVPTGRTKWFCSDECRDAYALAKRGRRQPPKFRSGAIPGQSSYWSISELQDFDKNIAYFGTDWKAIAKHMGTKTHNMVKNQYVRLVEGGKLDLEQMAKEADARRNRGEDLGPPPTPTPGPKRRHELAQASVRPISPTLEHTSPPPNPLERGLELTTKEADVRKLATAGLARDDEVFYRYPDRSTDPEMQSIEGEGVLCRITSVIDEGKQRRYEIIEAKPDTLPSFPFDTTDDNLFAISSNSMLYDLAKGSDVIALYPDSNRFYKAEVVADWSSSDKERNRKLVRVRFVDEDKNDYGDVERKYVIPVLYSK